MKKLTITALLALLCLVSCKKSSNENDDSPLLTPSIDGTKTGAVSINGTIYSTVVIGKKTWTSVNYNGNGGMVNTKANNQKYGKHYTLKEALAIELPVGWRLPSESDFVDLMRNYDGSYGYSDTATPYTNDFHVIELMSKETWVNSGNKYLPTNRSGFNALAGGTYNVTFKYFVQEEYETGFWSTPYSRPFMITNQFKNGIGTYIFYRGFSTADSESRFNLRL